MLRSDNNQRILDEIAELSCYQEARLIKASVISMIAPKIFPNKNDRVSRVTYSIDLFSNSQYEVLGTEG